MTAVTDVRLVVGDSAFAATGRAQIDPGWREILPEHDPLKALPPLSEGDVVPIQELRIVEERTKPPPLHSQGSLLLAMQRLELGTKSTRHEILDLLFRRQFVSGRSMRTTAAGRALVDALANYGPDLASPEMTRHLEDRMTAIAEGHATLDEVVGESRRALHGVVAELRSHRESLSRWLTVRRLWRRPDDPATRAERLGLPGLFEVSGLQASDAPERTRPTPPVGASRGRDDSDRHANDRVAFRRIRSLHVAEGARRARRRRLGAWSSSAT